MIPRSHITPSGEVALWEATDDGHRKVMLVATDAVHALQVDPDRWSLPDEPGGPPSVSAKETAVEQDVALSATAEQEDQTTEQRSASEWGGESAQ